MKIRIQITSLATAILTLLAIHRAAAGTPALEYTLNAAPEIKKAFHGSDSIEIRQITGTAPKLQVGGTYRVTGVCHQQSLKHAALYIGNTADAGPDVIAATSGSSLRQPLSDAHTSFDVTFTLLRPGILHVTIYDLDNHDRNDNAYAGIYLGNVVLQH